MDTYVVMAVVFGGQQKELYVEASRVDVSEHGMLMFYIGYDNDERLVASFETGRWMYFSDVSLISSELPFGNDEKEQ